MGFQMQEVVEVRRGVGGLMGEEVVVRVSVVL